MTAAELDLLYRARDGDKDARRAFMQRHIGLIKRVAQVAGKFDQRDPGEYFGACVDGFMHAVRHFKPELGFTWSTYAWKSMRGYCQTERARTRPTNRADHADSVYLADVQISLARYEAAERRRFSDVEIERLRRAIALLPDRERVIVVQRMAGVTLTSLGTMLGISKERIRQLQLKAGWRLWRMLVRWSRSGDILPKSPESLGG